MSTAIIDARGISKVYPLPAGDFTALSDVDLRVEAGEFLAVVGRSGSGKTTLLNLLAGIDRATAGTVTIDGTELGTLSESRLARARGTSIGLVFQFFQLLPTLTVLENVMLPIDFAGGSTSAQRRTRALELLGRVDIAEQADKLPSTLSGGQQQRAAIARALANDPPVLLADEPTGNLDSATADSVLALFASLADSGKAVVMVTHDRDASGFASRILTMADGRVSTDMAVLA
ncbi:MAG: ABC transporter ATP-binding protein [Pseudolysinimonas sp.]